MQNETHSNVEAVKYRPEREEYSAIKLENELEIIQIIDSGEETNTDNDDPLNRTDTSEFQGFPRVTEVIRSRKRRLERTLANLNSKKYRRSIRETKHHLVCEICNKPNKYQTYHRKIHLNHLS